MIIVLAEYTAAHYLVWPANSGYRYSLRTIRPQLIQVPTDLSQLKECKISVSFLVTPKTAKKLSRVEDFKYLPKGGPGGLIHCVIREVVSQNLLLYG